ncbi:MAG: oxidoreductase [Planctomycetaceae bacterium]|nr:oxidoreductase [Planctomycetaceae bacterium]
MNDTPSLLDLHQFVVKEHYGLLKMTDAYDILDPETQQKVGMARENISGGMKLLRLLINKRLLPTAVDVTEGEEGGAIAFRITRGFTFLRARVMVEDSSGEHIGYFKSKVFSLGGGFYVYDMQDNQVAEVKGNWKGRNFKFLSPSGNELGLVDMKWGGIGKELFTSADTYMVSLDEDAAQNRIATILLLAAALAIDIVFKETA